MRNFLLVLLTIPLLELIVFLVAGNLLGVKATILIVIGTGLIGAILLKKQGLHAIRNVQKQLQAGMMPGEAILDGLCILLGGILLLFPGFLTDIVGVIFLFPLTRRFVKKLLIISIQRKLRKQNRVTIIHR